MSIDNTTDAVPPNEQHSSNIAEAANEADDDEYDVIIVGAGLAGLVTGHELQRHAPTLRWCIIEATHYCGGHLHRLAALQPLLGEVATGFSNLDETALRSLCDELLMPIQMWPNAMAHSAPGARDWDLDGGRFADAVHLELQRFEAWMNEVSNDFHPGSCTNTSARKSWWSMESVIRWRLWFGASRQLVRMLVRYVSGCSPDDITFVEWMLLCNSSGGLSNQMQCLTGCAPHMWRCSPHFYDCIERLVRSVGTDNIRLNSELRTIDHRYDAASGAGTDTLQLRCRDGRQYSTDAVVLAIPQHEFCKLIVSSTPAGSPPRDCVPLCRRPTAAPQYATSFTAEFAEPFWLRHANNAAENSGGSFISLAEPMFVAYCTALEPRPTLSGLILHPAGVAELPGDVREAILQRLYRGGDPADRPTSVVWHQDTWRQTAYRERLTVSAVAEAACGASAWRRFVWSGRNVAVLYRGLSCGAVQAGRMAAQQALQQLRPGVVDAAWMRRVQPAHAVRPQRLGWVERFGMWWNLCDAVRLALAMPVLVVVWRNRVAFGGVASAVWEYVAEEM